MEIEEAILVLVDEIASRVSRKVIDEMERPREFIKSEDGPLQEVTRLPQGPEAKAALAGGAPTFGVYKPVEPTPVPVEDVHPVGAKRQTPGVDAEPKAVTIPLQEVVEVQQALAESNEALQDVAAQRDALNAELQTLRRKAGELQQQTEGTLTDFFKLKSTWRDGVAWFPVRQGMTVQFRALQQRADDLASLLRKSKS